MSRSRLVIYLDRRTCIIEPGRIDVRPAREAALLPLAGVIVGAAAFAAIPLFLDHLPFPVAVLLLLVALVTLPLSGMGLVYAIAGANVTADGAKQSILWQQGLLGMGVGTRELVPFWKVAGWAVEEMTMTRRGDDEADDISRYEIVLHKTSGRRLVVGATTMPRSLSREALARARGVAEAFATLTDKPLTAPGRRRARRQQSAQAEAAEQAAT